MLGALRKPVLGAAGVAVAAASLVVAVPSTEAMAAESVVKISPAQTELIQSNLLMQNAQPAQAVIESCPSDWEKRTVNEGQGVVCKNGIYSSASGTIVVRYDNIGQADGKWVSARLTFSNIQGDRGGIPDYPAGVTGMRFSIRGFWGGFTYFNARSVDVKVDFFLSDTKEPINLSGSMITFGSLDGVQGIGIEGVRYLTSKDYKSYVLSDNQLKHYDDGTWKGDSQTGWVDVMGDPTYNKHSVCYLLADASPRFRLTNEGANGASWVSLSTSALTAIVPNPPVKGALLTE